MTDKQIIIDGVPVQDCCYFDYENDGYEDSCYIHQNECSAQNCYYKQLKRKEQEYERLKNERTIDLVKQLDQLKAENDELKKDKFYLEREVMQLEKDVKDLNYFAMKLKQTLTEIKEIAEKIDDSGGCAYGDYDCDNCSSLEQETVCTYKVKKLILQKISECEVK